MAVRIAGRLRQAEKATAKKVATPAPETQEQWSKRFWSAIRNASPEFVEWVERHVVPIQRYPLAHLVLTADDEILDELEEWYDRPFAPWATMPTDYVFPEMLVAAFVWPADGRATMAGAPSCEKCGLRAPRYRIGEFGGDGFGCCPACYCPTTQAANCATGPVADSQPMDEKHRWPRVWRKT